MSVEQGYVLRFNIYGVWSLICSALWKALDMQENMEYKHILLILS